MRTLLQLQDCSALNLYYKLFEDERGQRHIQKRLRAGDYALAAGSSNERAYCYINRFFRWRPEVAT